MHHERDRSADQRLGVEFIALELRQIATQDFLQILAKRRLLVEAGSVSTRPHAIAAAFVVLNLGLIHNAKFFALAEFCGPHFQRC